MIQADLAIIQTIFRIIFRPTIQPIQIAVENVPVSSEVLSIGWGLLGDVSYNFIYFNFDN